jgi:HAMP domain-containing protein
MKVIPGVPGSFTVAEWVAFVAWSALGAAFWLLRPTASREGAMTTNNTK